MLFAVLMMCIEFMMKILRFRGIAEDKAYHIFGYVSSIFSFSFRFVSNLLNCDEEKYLCKQRTKIFLSMKRIFRVWHFIDIAFNCLIHILHFRRQQFVRHRQPICNLPFHFMFPIPYQFMHFCLCLFVSILLLPCAFIHCQFSMVNNLDVHFFV